MVSIAIIGILVALVLPAVQSARMAAAKLSCESRLRQIVIAADSYQETYKVYPVVNRYYRAMLPFLEQSAAYERLLLELPTPLNVTTYVCPSDPRSDPAQGHVSYLLNDGSGWVARQPPNYNQLLCDGIGTRQGHYSRLADFTDGMSQTAFFSERKINVVDEQVTEDNARSESNRFLWYLGTSFVLPNQLDLFRQECQTSRVNVTPHLSANYQFLLQQDTGYNHALTPNQPGCHNGTSSSDIEILYSLRPATSYHVGGVNVAFLDGHVRFVSDNIDGIVWRAISTSRGMEGVGDF